MSANRTASTRTATWLRRIGVAIVGYALAWLLSFLMVVGFEPALVPSYFVQGWTFSGLELVMFVWLCAWPNFLALLLAMVFVRYLRRRWKN